MSQPAPLTEAANAWRLYTAASANIARLEGYARRNEAMAKDLLRSLQQQREARQQLDAILGGAK